MKYSTIPLAQTVVALCKLYHITHVVISPGSRNAPLTISFTHDTFFTCYSIVDERCAAFFALGIAQQQQHPVALVCTSGSALLNYYPAISEAYYSHIPLVVLTADRPDYLVNIGDGQTITQHNVYGSHVHYSANLKLDLRSDSRIEDTNTKSVLKSPDGKTELAIADQNDIQTYNETTIRAAFHKSIAMSGPVHVNIPFDEPLYNTVDALSIHVTDSDYRVKDTDTTAYDIEWYQNIWRHAKRKLVLIGVLPPNTIEAKWLEMLSSDASVIVFSEITSNVYHPDFFPSIDKIIAPLESQDFERLQPDVLLTLGGMVVSKKVKTFLRTYTPKHHWHVGEYNANDTFFCLSQHFKLVPNTFFSTFFERQADTVTSDYSSYWIAIRNRRRQKHNKYLETIPFSDIVVFDAIIKSLPEQCQLQVGNSSAIRYMQLFQIKKTITVFCNRGTSGIDGCTSTAIGAAVASGTQTVCITGDLSFFYDSNALWNAYIPKSFRILVINNGGGGIFRILPGHKNTDNFDTYFETKHQLTAVQLCDMYGFAYSKAADSSTLDDALQDFYSISERPKLLEIFTPSQVNDAVLLQYFKYIT